MRPRAIALVLALSATAVALGCGASERAPDAAAVAERFQASLDRDDGERACAELSEETRSKLEMQDGRPCEEAILDLDLPSGRVAGHVSVYVTTASVDLEAGGTTFLDEGKDGWKVSATGCRPSAPELPYECELED